MINEAPEYILRVCNIIKDISEHYMGEICGNYNNRIIIRWKIDNIPDKQNIDEKELMYMKFKVADLALLSLVKIITSLNGIQNNGLYKLTKKIQLRYKKFSLRIGFGIDKAKVNNNINNNSIPLNLRSSFVFNDGSKKISPDIEDIII